MIIYDKNSAMQRYVDNLINAGRIIRAAKRDVFGVSEKLLLTTEEAEVFIKASVKPSFADLAGKLSKKAGSEACDAILGALHLVLNHPELINDIADAIQTGMKP
jgi:hypothetical protein